MKFSTAAEQVERTGRIIQTPARAPSTHADAAVPFSQAAISGLLIASSITLVITVVVLFVDKSPTWEVAGVLIGLWIGCALLVTTVLWFGQLSAAQRTIWTVERVFGDIDGDGVKGRPARWIPVINKNSKAPVVQNDAQWQKFTAFVTWAYDKGRTDIRTARRAGYSDDDWKLYMDALEVAGLVVATRKGENAPRRLVAPNAHACLATMQQRGVFD